jgi:hypothetical protein
MGFEREGAVPQPLHLLKEHWLNVVIGEVPFGNLVYILVRNLEILWKVNFFFK